MMNRAVRWGLLLAILFGSATIEQAQGSLDQRVSELSQQIASKMAARQKTTVAVVEFTDLQGNVTDLGRFLAEELVTRLGDLEKFRVIERQLLAKIIAEQKLSLTGVVDPASAKQLGKILGVDAIVAGSVTNLAQSVRVNARLISTETGEVFATASVDIFKDESVIGLLSASGPSLQTSNSPSKQSNVKKDGAKNVTVREFIFELEGCRFVASGAVVCSLTITNNAQTDRTVRLSNPSDYFGQFSRAFDEFGGEYVTQKILLGTRSSDGYTYVRNILVPQVPTKLRITFDNVNPDAKLINLLRIGVVWEDSNEIKFNADLRGITIMK
jgi:TolB-like protein